MPTVVRGINQIDAMGNLPRMVVAHNMAKAMMGNVAIET